MARADPMPVSATVVIATRDRPTDLARCLSALEAQDVTIPFDVIVVDDGSVTPVQAPAGARLGVRVLRTSGIGPGQARNAGVQSASSDVILFTDDDVVVDPMWVSCALAHLDANPGDAGVEGAVRSPPWDPLYETSIETSEPGHRWTCNVAYRRSVLLAVGGFAACFPAAHCEDRDLGLRVAAVRPIGFEPRMVVTHSPRAVSKRQIIDRGRLVASDLLLERRHPDAFPKGRIPLSGPLMHPIRMARDWLMHAMPGSPYRIRSSRRATRFVVVAGGQVLLAMWTAWTPSGSRVMRDTRAAAKRMLPASVYRLCRQRLLARRIGRFERRIVTHTYGATTLTLELADSLAEAWYDHDWAPLPELERLRDHGLVRGARVFDVGAHQGVVALMLADVVGDRGTVIAVEAEPHNTRVAATNRTLNAANNLEIVHAAGAATPGTVLFAESLNGHVEDHGSHRGKIRVAAVTVDELATRFGAPDVVIVDVEGFEGEVLAGAAYTIAAGRSTFLVEVHVGHGLDRPPEEILAVFGASYRLMVAPAEGGTDRFRDYQNEPDTLSDRFFLIAAQA
jgi:FkbM family methyltransferase